MLDTVKRFLAGLASESDRRNLLGILSPLADRYASQTLTSGALVIKAGSSALAKTGSVVLMCIASGVLVKKAAATDMPALVGTVTNLTFNVFCFFIDRAGNLTSAMGTAGATLALVKFPAIPEGKAMIGFISVNPTGTGDFVGGTTALDDATVFTTAATDVLYVNTVGAFDPTVLV